MPRKNPYLVKLTIEQGGTPKTEERLVQAKTRAQAIAHVVSGSVTCEIATAADIARVVLAGRQIESALESDPEESLS